MGNLIDRLGVIILAAGSSDRMCGKDKILVPVLGHPLIAYSVQTFNDSPIVESIVLVMNKSNVIDGEGLVSQYGWNKVSDICIGGKRRQDSMAIGLNSLKKTNWTAIHDGARPCVDEDMISAGLETAKKTGAAVPAIPVKDTIKSVSKDLIVNKTITRENLWAAQTPQIFNTNLLTQARSLISDSVTDDATMIELSCGKVGIFVGSYRNLKVTTLTDLPIVETMLKTNSSLKSLNPK